MNSKISIFLFSLLLLISFRVLSQSKKKETDSTFVKSFKHKILLKVNYETQTDYYEITNKEKNETAQIASNAFRRIFFSFHHDFLGLSIGFSPSVFTSNGEDLKGESSYTSIKFKVFIKKWLQGFEYQDSNGYYIVNSGDYIPDWIEGIDDYKQLPNLNNMVISGHTTYVINPNFSVRSLTDQIEKQLKNAGSIIPSLEYSYSKLTNKSDGANIKNQTFDIEINLGYYYTFVLGKKWFLTPGINGSIGPRFSKYEITENQNTTSDKNQYLSRKLQTGLQAGYDSGKIVFGGSIDYLINSDNGDAYYNVLNDKFYMFVYFGYRLNASKGFKKPFDWVHKTFNF